MGVLCLYFEIQKELQKHFHHQRAVAPQLHKQTDEQMSNNHAIFTICKPDNYSVLTISCGERKSKSAYVRSTVRSKKRKTI